VRRNHGIEHATVHILTSRDPNLQVIGRADTTGFNIYGEVATNELEAAAHEAFVAAVQHADIMLERSAQNFDALDAKGVALCGLGLCDETRNPFSGRKRVSEIIWTTQGISKPNT
jgi:hypothetical protein